MFCVMQAQATEHTPAKRVQCRLCGSAELPGVVDLGLQALSGIFPSNVTDPVASYPLRLGLCSNCNLAQLLDTAPLEDMYGGNYGYRSGLNPHMVRHLEAIVRHAESTKHLDTTSTVLDIGANDGTLLGLYRQKRMRRIAMDPTLNNFAQHYEPDII